MTILAKLRQRLATNPVPTVPPPLTAYKKPDQEIESEVGNLRAINGTGTSGTTMLTIAQATKSEVTTRSFYRLQVPDDAHNADDYLRSKFDGLPLLVLDFETYYDGDYSLAKIPPLLYITDARFHIHGLGIRHPDGRAEFRPDWLVALLELQGVYGDQFQRTAVVMHNGYFDALVLWRHAGIKLTHICDTMLLSRLRYGAGVEHDLRSVAQRLGLPAKGQLDFMAGVRKPSASQLKDLIVYTLLDVELTHDVAVTLLPYGLRLPRELWCMEYSIRQLVERPLTIDRDQVSVGQNTLNAHIKDVIHASGCTMEQLRSTDQFAVILERALSATGRNVPFKPGKKGSIPALSKKDHAFQLLRNDADPCVQALVRAREVVMSANQQRARLSFLDHCATRLGKIHLQLGYGIAGPGRFQGAGGFNAQNLSKRAADGESVNSAVRRAIQAPDGQVLVAADAAQIEARILAFLAGEQELHAQFAEGIDVYSRFASTQFHTEVRKPTSDDLPEVAARMKVLRQVGKQAILGLGYGMGVEKFENTLKSEPMLRELFDAGLLNLKIIAGMHADYRRQYAKIKQFWNDCEAAFRAAMSGVTVNVAGCRFDKGNDGITITLRSGRPIVYPDARYSREAPTPRYYVDATGQKQCFFPDSPSIVYSGSKNVYGGLLAENIVQGTARDILVHAIYSLEQMDYPVVFHCHDSTTVLTTLDRVEGAKKALIHAWSTVPDWISGLSLSVETSEGDNFYEI